MKHLLIFFLIPFVLFANSIPWPLTVKSHISGTFAEFRKPGILHMGIDIKTFGMNGLKVVSPFSGYIDYLRNSNYSYGLSVDIVSPDKGLRARYAHLLDLKGELKELELLQNSSILLNEGSPVNLKLPPEKFKTSEAMVIASTGESGSGISHLHFELMNHQGYINPLVFGNFAKNDYHPPIIRKIFIEDSDGNQKIYAAQKKSNEIYFLDEKPEVTGKIRIKVEGYDIITSSNKNNLFSLKLLAENKLLYERDFKEITFKDYSKDKFLIFDGNRSSLSPPVYVYNLFSNNDYSVDTAAINANNEINIKIILADAAENQAIIYFPILIKKSVHNLQKDSMVTNQRLKKKLFVSNDAIVKLDFSGSVVYGEPSVTIKSLSELPQEMEVKGLKANHFIYEINTLNFTWYKPAKAYVNANLKNGESLFLYNTETRQWNSLRSHSLGNGLLTFDFHRPGILAIMKDEIPPVIHFPYLMTRNIYLEPNPSIIERIYAVSDLGSGLKGKFEVYVENDPYPYYYDIDRKSIIVEIPKSFGNFRKLIPIRIRTEDIAGNKSDWFTDLIQLDSFK